jgi:hypothetical protein
MSTVLNAESDRSTSTARKLGSGAQSLFSGSGNQAVLAGAGTFQYIEHYHANDADASSDAQLQINDEPAAAIIEWMGELSCGLHLTSLDRHEQLLQKRTPGTSFLVLEDEAFVRWKSRASENERRFLWMYGCCEWSLAYTRRLPHEAC